MSDSIYAVPAVSLKTRIGWIGTGVMGRWSRGQGPLLRDSSLAFLH